MGKKQAQLIHEIHDLWPETLVTIGGMSKRHPFVMLLQRAENSAYRKSDKVIGFNEKVKAHCISHGMKDGAFACIPLGVNLEEWEQKKQQKAELSPELETAFQTYRKENKFIVGYFGGHALSNYLESMLQLAEIANTQDRSIQFVLVGNGVEKQKLIRTAQEKKLKNISFFDSIPRQKIPQLLSYFDCVYFASRKSPLYEKAGLTPNKVFDAMMAEKPILACIGDYSSPLDGLSCAFISRQEHPEETFEQLLRLKQMSESERTAMGATGKKAIIERFNYQINARRFAEVFYENSIN